MSLKHFGFIHLPHQPQRTLFLKRMLKNWTQHVTRHTRLDNILNLVFAHRTFNYKVTLIKAFSESVHKMVMCGFPLYGKPPSHMCTTALTLSTETVPLITLDTPTRIFATGRKHDDSSLWDCSRISSNSTPVMHAKFKSCESENDSIVDILGR